MHKSKQILKGEKITDPIWCLASCETDMTSRPTHAFSSILKHLCHPIHWVSRLRSIICCDNIISYILAVEWQWYRHCHCDKISYKVSPAVCQASITNVPPERPLLGTFSLQTIVWPFAEKASDKEQLINIWLIAQRLKMVGDPQKHNPKKTCVEWEISGSYQIQ